MMRGVIMLLMMVNMRMMVCEMVMLVKIKMVR